MPTVQDLTTTMKVYEGGVPSHAQIFVGPDQRAVDYLDAEGEVLTCVVLDVVSIEAIAEQIGATLETVSLGEVGPSATAVAAERTAAEAKGEPIPEEEPQADLAGVGDDDQTQYPLPLAEMSYDELYAMAKERNLKGRSSLSKDELVAALSEEG